MNIKLSQLRDILAIVETGSLRAAGRQLGIGQPSISRSVRDLESDLGITLFHRRATGVALTESGEMFARRAAAVQSELRRAYEEIEQIKGRSVGQVTMAMSAASGIPLLPKILADFRKRYPNSLLKLVQTLFQPIEQEIVSGAVDFFVGPWDEDLSATPLLVEHLFDNSRVVVARKDHPMAKATSLRELAGAQWIRPASSTRDGEADFITMFESEGLAPPSITVHSLSAQFTMIVLENSDLLTVLPRQWMKSPFIGDRIVQIPLPHTLHAAPVCIVRRGDLPLTPMAEYLCDMARKAGHNYMLGDGHA